MVKNVIVYRKYVFKETLFEFWGRLEKNEQKLQWESAPNNKLCVNELSIEAPGTKKHIKERLEESLEDLCSFYCSPRYSRSEDIPPQVLFVRNRTKVFQAIIYSHTLPVIPHSF